MTDLQFVAAIVTALAWPVAAVIAVRLVRPQLIGLFERMESLVFPGGKVTFASLAGVEAVAVAAKDAAPPDDKEVERYEATEFSAVEQLAADNPKEAVVEAWGLLEYQLNRVSDRLAPDQPHGWPQVVRNLEAWDMWPVLRPAVEELRRLRNDTVRSSRLPSSADATRYVSVAQDLATTIKTSFMTPASKDTRGAG